MALFDFLFPKSDPPIEDPERLRAELFAASQTGDLKRLESLSRTNQAAVLAHFTQWQKLPDAVRSDPQAVQAYVQAMVAVAECFAARLGRPELMAALTGGPDENPLTRWQEVLQQSRRMMNDLRYAEAKPLLTDALINSRGMQGSGVDRYLPITHGFVAECLFHSGDAEQALPHLQQALTACERSGDAEGIQAYLGSLFEANRYLGRSQPAAQFAERLAEVTGQSRWRTRARIVRSGEPANRVVAVIHGETFEIEEVRFTGELQIKFIFERNRISLRPADVWTERGNALASAGKLDEALEAFSEGAAADPFDPGSRYQHAFTLLQVGRFAEAADEYREVEQLAPGWFHCRADLWLAEQLALGNLEPNDFVALWILEDGSGSGEEKLAIAHRLVSRYPDLTPAYLQLGRTLARSGRTADACAALRTGLTKDGDSDVRTRLLTELALLLDDSQEQRSLYREAAALGGNLVAAATATLALQRSEQAAD